ncbi:protein Star-like [Palaemon carinicauda]|uniref:protein Star-like n=1 Tax=Palaemon carinicauda TaxID=392227 RepID=UPI0035B57B59
MLMAWRHPSTIALIEKITVSERKVDEDKVLISMEELLRSPLSVRPTDPWLIKRIRSRFLTPPSNNPYNLTFAQHPLKGKMTIIRNILKERRGGFFIETTALDGEINSHTLILEKELGWRGALIEGNPKYLESLRLKNRKAWTINACLSVNQYPVKVTLSQNLLSNRINEKPQTGTTAKPALAEVQCFPFYSILLALNTTVVDFFRLDVAGDEIKVLKTIPWDKVNIKVLYVKSSYAPNWKMELKKYLTSNHYNVFRDELHDTLFVKRDYAT